MTLQTINDPASVQRQGLLLAAFEATAAEWTARADRLHQIGDVARLEAALTAAYDARETAARIRMRLVAASQAEQPPGLADVLAKLPDDKLAQIAPTDCHQVADPEGDNLSWLPPGFVAPPLEFQTYSPPPLATVSQVVCWLRERLPEGWYRQSYATLRPVAEWLLWLRNGCWSGRWQP